MMRYFGLLITILLFDTQNITAAEDVEQRISITSRFDLLSKVKNDLMLSKAISRAADSLPKFLKAWHNHDFTCDQFIVTIVRESDSALVPIGIYVERIDDERIYGKSVQNELPIRTTAELTSCDLGEIIDWRYRQALEMVGGEVYRECLRRLAVSQRIDLEANVPFYIRDSISNPYRISVLDRDIEKLTTLLLEPKEIVQTRFEAPTRSSEGADWIGKTQVNIVEYMLMYGDAECVDVAIKCENRFGSILRAAPLFIAAGEGNCLAIKRLLELGADVNEIDEETGYTALHLAILLSDKEVASTLLAANANPNVLTYGNKTPMFFAKTKDLVDALVDAGGDLNATDDSGFTVLDRHLQDREYGLVEIIRRAGGETSGQEIHVELGMPSMNEIIDNIVREVGVDGNELRVKKESNYGAVLPIKDFNQLR